MGKIYKLPRHKSPVLHENAALMSFQNCHKLGKVYQEIIGLNNIHHFSLNVVDSEGKMSILSYNPQIAYNIFKDGSYLYNGSISSSYYDNFSLYTWDETYDPHYAAFLKNNMERKNGINKGGMVQKVRFLVDTGREKSCQTVLRCWHKTFFKNPALVY